MYLERFNNPIAHPSSKRFNKPRLEEVKSLLQRRYNQREIADMLGMNERTLSDFMIRHGLRKPQ